ncbi:MAG TPA: hypothetical protein VLE02_01260 [Nitrosarchaeum sp.]|nr:hypothetical protein [Nitrosarchaeum sp.]
MSALRWTTQLGQSIIKEATFNDEIVSNVRWAPNVDEAILHQVEFVIDGIVITEDMLYDSPKTRKRKIAQEDKTTKVQKLS